MGDLKYSRALAICDICGFQYYHDELRKDWRGLMVCRYDHDPKPDLLLKPEVYPEGVPVQDPRPDQFVPGTFILLASSGADITSDLVINPTFEYVMIDQNGIATEFVDDFDF